MKIYGTAMAVVNTLNKNVQVTVQTYLSATENADGSQTPNYNPGFSMLGQVQELSTDDLQHMDMLNIQGQHRAIYLSGTIDAISRLTQKGGDLITVPNGVPGAGTYLTTQVGEQFQDWVKVLATLQVD